MGIKLKQYLDAHGIKQSFVCEKTGLSKDVISGICSGSRRVYVEEYFSICEALNIPFDALYED